MEDVSRLVENANAMRRQDARAPVTGHDPESQLEKRFTASQVLAVYGTLAPGKPNHHVVAPLGGEWTDGFVEGELVNTGWGAALGYTAFRPRKGGDRIAVKLLTSPRLPAAWQKLDDFEGSEYRRILVIVKSSSGDTAAYRIANIYAAAD